MKFKKGDTVYLPDYFFGSPIFFGKVLEDNGNEAKIQIIKIENRKVVLTDEIKTVRLLDYQMLTPTTDITFQEDRTKILVNHLKNLK